MDESLALLGLICKKNIKWNDLKDKPFYEKKKDFRTGEIKTDFESGNAFVPLDINPNDFQLEVDTRIIVKWNGIEYPLITKTHSATDGDVYWGNGALSMPMLEDTGEPFFFRKTISGSSLGFNIISTQSSATWEIIVPDYYTELKTLDEKYIPDIALAKSFIIDRANRTITIGKTTSPVFTYDAATDDNFLTDDNFYNLAKAAIELGLCVVCNKTEDPNNIIYENRWDAIVSIPNQGSSNSIRIDDFHIKKQTS